MIPEYVIILLARIFMGVTIVSMMLAFYRIVRGPTRADRAVAVDLLALLLVGIMALYAMTENEPVFVDVAMVVVLISFLATVALAQYVQRVAQERDE
jgi:multicomponent Na+:H+ antiporter subunit F